MQFFQIEQWLRCKYQLELITYRNDGKKEIVLNQETRDDVFDHKKEFSPISQLNNIKLRQDRQAHLFTGFGKKTKKKVDLDCKGFAEDTKLSKKIQKIKIAIQIILKVS